MYFHNFYFHIIQTKSLKSYKENTVLWKALALLYAPTTNVPEPQRHSRPKFYSEATRTQDFPSYNFSVTLSNFINNLITLTVLSSLTFLCINFYCVNSPSSDVLIYSDLNCIYNSVLLFPYNLHKKMTHYDGVAHLIF
ncbi:hypothetical protein QTP88_022643 [Uroleucon formosanum]